MSLYFWRRMYRHTRALDFNIKRNKQKARKQLRAQHRKQVSQAKVDVWQIIRTRYINQHSIDISNCDLKMLRIRQNRTIEEVAESLGIKPQSVRTTENKPTNKMHPRTVVKFLHAIGLTVE